MDAFYPFIHNPKKKELEPEPLYIEVGPPPPSPKKSSNDDDDENSEIITIELF